MLKYEENGNVIYPNGKVLGQMMMNTDGFYVFFPEPGDGYWNGEVLLEIGEKLASMNKSWVEQIEAMSRKP